MFFNLFLLGENFYFKDLWKLATTVVIEEHVSNFLKVLGKEKKTKKTIFLCLVSYMKI